METLVRLSFYCFAAATFAFVHWMPREMLGPIGWVLGVGAAFFVGANATWLVLARLVPARCPAAACPGTAYVLRWEPPTYRCGACGATVELPQRLRVTLQAALGD